MSEEITLNVTEVNILHGALTRLADRIYQVNKANGWHETKRPFSADAALLHSEVAELYEAFRKNNGPSEHMPHFSAMEEEAADILIRLVDTCSRHNLALAQATLTKLAYNQTRGYKHGGKAE